MSETELNEQELRESIRKEESSKLHSTIERLTKELESTKEQLASAKSEPSESKVPDMTGVEKKIDTLISKMSQESGPKDKSPEMKAILSEFKELKEGKQEMDSKSQKTDSESSVLQELRSEMEAIRSMNEALSNEIKSQNLNLYRSEKIRSAGSDLIEEMVSGSTKEEIDDSIERAKATYAKYVGAKPDIAEEGDLPGSESAEDSSVESVNQPQTSAESVTQDSSMGPGAYSGPQNSPVPTGPDILMELASIRDPKDRLEFYQANQKEIKSAQRRLYQPS